MRFLEKYKCLILFLYLSISFSIDDFINIKNISSLINSNEIISFNNKITSLTDGGIYTINSLNQLENKIDYLTYSDLNTAAIDQFNRLWVGGSSPYGYIQILNSDFELLFTLDYANFNEIKKIVFTSSYAFAISENNGEYSIIKFSNNDNPSYLNIFNDFPLNNLIINDLVVMNDKLFLGTNNGLLEGDVNSNFLLFSSEWSQSYSGIDIKNIFFNEQDFYVISDNQIFKNDISIIDLDVDIFEAIYYDDQLYCLTENQLYSLGTNNQFNLIFDIPQKFSCIGPCDDDYGFTNFEILNDFFYLSLSKNGVIVIDNNFQMIDHIIPNSIFKNQFSSIKFNHNLNSLFGISKEGGFIITNPNSLANNTYIRNFYPINFDSDDDNILVNEYYRKYPEYLTDDDSRFFGKYLNYISGEKTPNSIDFGESGEFYIVNSGIYPSINQGHYNSIIDSVQSLGYDLDDIFYGGLYGINSENLELISYWGDEVFNGLGGITSNNNDGYTVINQAQVHNENLYILNPYSENWYNDELQHINIPICIKNIDDTWGFIEDNSGQYGYIPTQFTFDPIGNIWIAYRKYNNLSPGGIRVVQQNNNNLWYSNSLIPDLEGVNVFSIDFGKDINNNNILWLISDLGVMGYYVEINQFQNNLLDIQIVDINPYYYYSDIPFNENSKVKLDLVGNAWITTPGYGIKVILSNGSLWPNSQGINQSNSNLLSDFVFDISFDNNGYVYIATEKGISIIKTEFDLVNSNNTLQVSPNPFVVGEDNALVLSNFTPNSSVQIMTLNGYVVKEFSLTYQTSIINWNGDDSKGNELNTGIYILSSKSNNETKIGKIAIIN